MSTDNKIIITDVQSSDAKEVSDVYYYTWLETYPDKELGITLDDIEHHFKDRRSPERITKLQNAYKKLSDDERIIVAKDGDHVVGVARLIKHKDNNQLQSIYVLPDHQKKGIGRALWGEAVRFFDPHMDIVVEVATYNKKAIDFYTSLGFKDTGRRFTEERHRMKSGVAIPEIEMRIKR